MQTASVLVALAGDTGNTVQKWGVTPSEVAVLQLVHGSDAVTNIRVGEDVQRTNRAERERLAAFYGQPQPDGGFKSIAVDSLFPGAAARLFERFDELEIDEGFFVAPPPGTTITTASTYAAPALELSKLKKDALIRLAEQRGVDVADTDTKAAIIEAIEAAPEAAVDEVDDSGIEEMTDGNLFE